MMIIPVYRTLVGKGTEQVWMELVSGRDQVEV